MEYNDFIKLHKGKIANPISEGEYINLKSYISSEVDNIISFYGLKNIKIDICVNGIILYLLQSKTYDDIMINGYEEEIYKATMEYNNRVNRTNNNTVPKREDGALSYIRSSLLEIKNIFANNTDFDKLSIDIYSLLLHEGYTAEMIKSSRCDNRIISLIKNRKDYNQISFSQEFDSFRNRVSDLTYDILKKLYYQENDDDYILEGNNSIYKEDKYMREIAFRASLALFLEGYTKDNLDYKKLSTFIENDLKRIKIKQRSVIKEAQRETTRSRVDYEKLRKQELTAEEKKRRKRRLIIIIIIISDLILENVVFGPNGLFKKIQAEKEKKKSPKYAYSIPSRSEYPEGPVGDILRASDNNRERGI